ncbi:hypothetical protein C2G38_2066165 [Gigaspora rosea]|uniref:Uncharacterized protein n=1 Tax=Gigaspora rosea TaxID=44941 RepID=A0A397VW47_9GLOM|nr:hypothetical protein C2G38_2066165 [Gigaspora rosea]
MLSHYFEELEKIHEKEEQIDQLTKEVNNALNCLKQKEDQLKEENSNKEKLKVEINDLKTTLAEREKEIKQLQAEKKILTTRLKNYQKISKLIQEKEQQLEKRKKEYISGMGLNIFKRAGKRKEVEDKLDTFINAIGELIRRPGSDFAASERKKAEDYLRNKPGYPKLIELQKVQKELTELEMQLDGLQDENELKNQINLICSKETESNRNISIQKNKKKRICSKYRHSRYTSYRNSTNRFRNVV